MDTAFASLLLLCLGNVCLGSLNSRHDIRKRSSSSSSSSSSSYTLPPFTCNVSAAASVGETTSIHRLRPADVNVVAALGDSLTAGMGAGSSTVVQDLFFYRGLSWSCGGDDSLEEGVLTYPNVQREYSPSVYGYATGVSTSKNPNAKLNMGVPGAKAFDMADQARDLIDRMKDSVNDYDLDWKIITIFIGSNDLCAACKDWDMYSAQNYSKGIEEALDILQAEVPRALVNLASALDVTPITQLGINSSWCSFTHQLECSCAANASNSERLSQLAREYQDAADDLVATGKYDTGDSFTVVVQPFYSDTKPPVIPGTDEPDLSYFSHDCFHFSQKGQATAGLALWNNMCEGVGQKERNWYSVEDFTCPGENGVAEYFRTSRN